MSLHNDSGSERLTLVFGNQIVCKEGLEVLVYGHDSIIASGMMLNDTIEAASA